MIGLKLYEQLILEMTVLNKGRTISSLRRISTSFRDTTLLEIFISIEEIMIKCTPFTKDIFEALKVCLTICNQAINFEFTGIVLDETLEDPVAINIPISWKSSIIDENLLKMLFGFCAAEYPNEINELALKCICDISFVRISIFKSIEERKEYAKLLYLNYIQLFKDQRLIDNLPMAKLLVIGMYKFLCNFKLRDVNPCDLPSLIAVIYNFSEAVLCKGAKYFNLSDKIISSWVKMANEVSYAPSDLKNANSYLLDYLSKLAKVYIGEGIKYTHFVEEDDGCFEFSESIQEKNSIFEQFGELLLYTRYDTIKCIELNLDNLISSYENSITSQNLQYKESLEISISWMVRLICELVNAYIRNQNAIKSYDRKEIIICAKILKLMIFTEKLPRCNPHLESSFMAFMTAFKRYLFSLSDAISEDVNNIGKEDISIISSVIEVNSFVDIIDIFINRIFRDFAVWGSHKQMLKEVATALDGFTIGSSMISLLKASKSIAALNNCHWNRIFVEDHPKMEIKIGEALCKIALYEDSEYLPKLLVSISPQFNNINTLLSKQAIDPTEKKFVLKLIYMITGIMKDLYIMTQFDVFFSWIYGERLAMIRHICECSWCNCDIINAIIKFYMELTNNSSHRLRFDSVSINGILIFKEVANQIARFIVLIRNVNVVKKPYDEKYRFYKMIFVLFRQCIKGGFVNFGVFILYNDTVFAQVLKEIITTITKIDYSEIIAYQKLESEIMGIIDDVCSTHTCSLILNISDDVLISLFNLIIKLINSENNEIVAQACTSISSFYGYMLNSMKNPPNPIYGNALQIRIDQFVGGITDLSYLLLKKILSIICHEEGPQLYMFSSPLYCLILTNGSESFSKAKSEVLQLERNGDIREKLSNELDKLLQEVVPEFTDLSKQQFHKKYTAFTNAVKTII